jgi:Tat protein secretion system quality control protein TatD with DNase activity
LEEISLVDAHAHLAEMKSLPEALEQARQERVLGIIAAGIDVESNSSLGEVARIKGLDPSSVAKRTTENASRFFQILFQSRSTGQLDGDSQI